jgi:hypothetical protein
MQILIFLLLNFIIEFNALWKRKKDLSSMIEKYKFSFQFRNYFPTQ